MVEGALGRENCLTNVKEQTGRPVPGVLVIVQDKQEWQALSACKSIRVLNPTTAVSQGTNDWLLVGHSFLWNSIQSGVASELNMIEFPEK